MASGIFSLTKSVQEEADDIVALFNKNYKDGYYNQNFSSGENLRKLISQESFIGVTAKSNHKIVGFSGIYVDKYAELNKIYLANFLVDEDYRGKGLGNLIDEKKVEICNSIAGRSIVYSILAETTIASVKIKENYGYKIWGIRLFYGELEPNQTGDGHLLVMGKSIGIEEKMRDLDNLHAMTRAMINLTSTPAQFSSKVAIAHSLFCAYYPSNVDFGQYACIVKQSDYGFPIESIIERVLLNKDTCPYLVIRLDIKDVNPKVEEAILNAGFFPTSFLPHFDHGADIIEYQYVSPEKISRISKLIPYYDLVFKN